MKILHCITGLTGDGAQRMLLRLTQGLQGVGIASEVVNLGPSSALAREFERSGVRVHTLGLSKSPLRALHGLRSLRLIISESRAEILQGWMYHANVMLLLARGSARRDLPLLWNIRRGLDDHEERSRSTRCVIAGSAWSSRWVSGIIYCSSQSRRQHEACGFRGDRGMVIENGFETNRFVPSEESRRRFRESLGIRDHELVIGNVGRFDVAKGHEYLIDAFRRLLVDVPQARLVCVGRGMDQSNQEILQRLGDPAERERVLLLGERTDVETIYPGFDIMCSSSISEGFPNALSEAMSCGVPSVATDTGASADLVSGVGELVPTRDAAAIARALRVVALKSAPERTSIGNKARQRIEERFSLPAVVGRYAELYQGIGTR